MLHTYAADNHHSWLPTSFPHSQLGCLYHHCSHTTRRAFPLLVILSYSFNRLLHPLGTSHHISSPRLESPQQLIFHHSDSPSCSRPTSSYPPLIQSPTTTIRLPTPQRASRDVSLAEDFRLFEASRLASKARGVFSSRPKVAGPRHD